MAKKDDEVKSPTQLKIAGTDGPSVPEVNAAAELYQHNKKNRMRWSKKEKESKVALIGAMKKAGLTSYRDNDANPPLYVTVNDKSDVTVDEVNTEDAGEEEQEDAGEEPN